MKRSGREFRSLSATDNRLDQLRRLLDSIARCVVMPWTLHVADAGSIDGTAEWLTECARTDVRIVPHLQERRLGQAAALNELASAAPHA